MPALGKAERLPQLLIDMSTVGVVSSSHPTLLSR